MPLSGFEQLKPLDVNFEFYIGEIFSADIVVDLDNGTPMNLSTSTAATKMAFSKFTTKIALITQITNSAQGIVNISLTNTANIVAGRYEYSTILTSPSGLKIKVAEGIISAKIR